MFEFLSESWINVVITIVVLVISFLVAKEIILAVVQDHVLSHTQPLEDKIKSLEEGIRDEKDRAELEEKSLRNIYDNMDYYLTQYHGKSKTPFSSDGERGWGIVRYRLCAHLLPQGVSWELVFEEFIALKDTLEIRDQALFIRLAIDLASSKVEAAI